MTQPPLVGDRIRLVSMLDDPDPIRPGTTGTVTHVSCHDWGRQSWQQISVAWDNGRTLMLVVPPDEFESVSPFPGDGN